MASCLPLFPPSFLPSSSLPASCLSLPSPEPNPPDPRDPFSRSHEAGGTRAADPPLAHRGGMGCSERWAWGGPHSSCWWSTCCTRPGTQRFHVSPIQRLGLRGRAGCKPGLQFWGGTVRVLPALYSEGSSHSGGPSVEMTALPSSTLGFLLWKGIGRCPGQLSGWGLIWGPCAQRFTIRMMWVFHGAVPEF